jgi:hypothetical protein
MNSIKCFLFKKTSLIGLKLKIGIFVLICFAFNCSGSKNEYLNDGALLTPMPINSKDGSLTFYIPVNWDSIKVIKNSNYDFILTDRDKKYSITLNELKVPFNLRELMDNEGMNIIEKIDYEMLKMKYDDILTIVYSGTEKKLDKCRYCEYEFTGNKNPNRGRVIVFDDGRKLWELIAVTNSATLLKNNVVDSLFGYQQSMLNYLKIK